MMSSSSHNDSWFSRDLNLGMIWISLLLKIYNVASLVEREIFFGDIRLLCGLVAEWLGRWTCDQQVCSVIKQYNLVPANGQWCFAAGKVTVGLASHWPHITDISGSTYGLKA